MAIGSRDLYEYLISSLNRTSGKTNQDRILAMIAIEQLDEIRKQTDTRVDVIYSRQFDHLDDGKFDPSDTFTSPIYATRENGDILVNEPEEGFRWYNIGVTVKLKNSERYFVVRPHQHEYGTAPSIETPMTVSTKQQA